MRNIWCNIMRIVMLVGLYGVYSVLTKYSLGTEWLLLMLVASAIFAFHFLSSFKWVVIGRRVEYHFLRFNERIWNRLDRWQQRINK